MFSSDTIYSEAKSAGAKRPTNPNGKRTATKVKKIGKRPVMKKRPRGKKPALKATPTGSS